MMVYVKIARLSLVKIVTKLSLEGMSVYTMVKYDVKIVSESVRIVIARVVVIEHMKII